METSQNNRQGAFLIKLNKSRKKYGNVIYKGN